MHTLSLHQDCNMRLALFLGICLAFVFVVESFVEEELFEDKKEYDTRHHLKKCSGHDDCEIGECCGGYWFRRRCLAKKRLGETCRVRPWKCQDACRDGLVCRRAGSPGPDPDDRHHRSFKCYPAPTEEPGSGDHDDF